MGRCLSVPLPLASCQTGPALHELPTVVNTTGPSLAPEAECDYLAVSPARYAVADATRAATPVYILRPP